MTVHRMLIAASVGKCWATTDNKVKSLTALLSLGFWVEKCGENNEIPWDAAAVRQVCSAGCWSCRQCFSGPSGYLMSTAAPREPSRRESRKRVEYGECQEQRVSKSTGLSHLWTHKDWGSMHRACTRYGLRNEKISGHKLLFLTKKRSPIDNHLQVKI